MTTTSLKADDWVDGKRYFWMLGLVVPLIPFIAWGLVAFTGWGGFWWLGPAFIYGVLPLLDHLVGEDRNNPPESQVGVLEQQAYYRCIVMLFVPLQYVATAFGAWMAVNGDLALWELAGLLLSLGFVNGIGINTAHELGHKREASERWLAKLALAPVAYGHFYVEHNRGHHVRVATPEDPASSAMGESFWHFLPRTVVGSVRSAWDLERRRLQREGRGPWSVHNENLQAWSMTVLLFAGLCLWLGWAALPFLVLQAAYGASLLEVVNYLEHYGLLREKDASGRYERCQPRHSWNSNHTVTNLFLYQLQRHSDHHANPMRRYQALRHFDDSPQLPSGYAALIPIAYIPCLWFRMMDHRVVQHYAGDLRQAHLYAPKREALLRRYASPAAEARRKAPEQAP